MSTPVGGDFSPKISDVGPFSVEGGLSSSGFIVRQQVNLNGRVVVLKLRYSGLVDDSRVAEDLDSTMRKVAALVDHYDLGRKTSKLYLVKNQVTADDKVGGHFEEGKAGGISSKFTRVEGGGISLEEEEKINLIYRAALGMSLKRAVPKNPLPVTSSGVEEKKVETATVRELQTQLWKEEQSLKEAIDAIDAQIAKRKEAVKELFKNEEELEKAMTERQKLYKDWSAIHEEHSRFRIMHNLPLLEAEVDEIPRTGATFLEASEDPPPL